MCPLHWGRVEKLNGLLLKPTLATILSCISGPVHPPLWAPLDTHNFIGQLNSLVRTWSKHVSKCLLASTHLSSAVFIFKWILILLNIYFIVVSCNISPFCPMSFCGKISYVFFFFLNENDSRRLLILGVIPYQSHSYSFTEI